VARSLDARDIETDRVVPHPDRLRDVGLEVATAVVLRLQEEGLAEENLGQSSAEVRAALAKKMWAPDVSMLAPHSRM